MKEPVETTVRRGLGDVLSREMESLLFEPFGPEIWDRLKRAIEDFLTDVWRNGALEGETPSDAFSVTIDETTMTQDDIDAGRLIVEIGIAPVKPAEFVIFRYVYARPEP